MSTRFHAPNGSIFLVPLPTGGYGVGVLVRSDGKGRAYGIFFGPRVVGETGVDIRGLCSENAVVRFRFGDYGLHSKRGPIIGLVSGWKDAPWPLPQFRRPHDNPFLCYVSSFDDKLNCLAEDIVPASLACDLPEEAQYGSGIIEKKLDDIL